MANRKYNNEDLILKKDNIKVQHSGAKCYIYTRVSTQKQVDEGNSLEAQHTRMLEYADFEQMTVVGEYSDEGISGKSAAQRDGFMQMMKDIENGKDGVSFVLVFKLSRFGRNASDILEYLQKMQDQGVNLICVEDHIDSSDGSGKLLITIMGAVAEMERENILVQSMAGRWQKASEGGWNGGFAPYGYRLEGGSMVIDEEQAEIVRIIYDKYITTNLGADGVAKWLNKHGYVKTPPHVLQTKKERKHDFLTQFARGHIVRILDNEFYMGKLAYGKRENFGVKGKRGVTVTRKSDHMGLYEGEHEGIVSEETWNLAHEKRLSLMEKPEKREKDHEYILSRLLRCPECGAPLYGAVNRTKKRADGTPYPPYYYYKCKCQFGQTGHSCSFKTQIGANKMDKEVRDVIMSLVSSKKMKTAAYSKIGQAVNTDDIQNEIDTLEKEQRQTERRLKMRSKEKDCLDIDDKHYDRKYKEITEAMDGLYEKLDELEEEIAERRDSIIAIKKNQITQERVYNLLIHFADTYDKMKNSEKKDLMELFIEKIEIYPQKQENGRRVKRIDFRFPISEDDGEENRSIFPSLPSICRDSCPPFAKIIQSIGRKKQRPCIS